ncbi:response regulator transcription factor [bacterium]|nr:response regulator transcription factor [bacterium]
MSAIPGIYFLFDHAPPVLGLGTWTTLIKVMLVDDHEMVVSALSQMLANVPGFEVVAQLCNAELAWDFLCAHSVDVVVTDLELPGASGAELATRILTNNPAQGIVVLSYRVDPAEVRSLIGAGVRGYVPKSESASQLTRAIAEVACGREHFASAAVKAIIDSLRTDQSNEPSPLTMKQTVILLYMSRGLTTRQIAEEVRLSTKTVEKYRGEIFRRLDCKNQVQALAIARRLHILNESWARPQTR